MTNSEDGPAPYVSKGSAAALIEEFRIDGLHGYRSVSFSSNNAATILIARNGSGKTTLLGAMDALLKRQFFRLRDLQFKELFCKFTEYDEQIILSRQDIDEILTQPNDIELAKLSQRTEIPERDLFQFILGEWSLARQKYDPSSQIYEYFIDNKIFSAVLRSSEWHVHKASNLLDNLFDSLIARNTRIMSVISLLNNALREIDIVYLPTYRRIELALDVDEGEARQKRRRPKFNISSGSLYTGDIQFGLTDISERLKELNSRIVRDSSLGYRKLSANVINDMLDDGFEQKLEHTQPTPPIDDLRLFFARLEASKHYGAYIPAQMPDLEKLERNANSADAPSKFLNYFLRQLTTVIDSTKDIERSVENFVESCNRYLGSDELSTTQTKNEINQHRTTIDGKRLQLNRQDLSVYVESIPSGRQISLDALSSGEKQMISLFARLYLYENPKIVLIDEPELSLSIDWQRSILVDVLNAPRCRQVVAITHSPFVFDNELEPFARPLKVKASSLAGDTNNGCG